MFWMNTTTKYQEVLYSRTLNKYKRIFHHIDFKEAKSKHLEDLAVKKLEEEKNIKKEKQISKIVEEKKYSWRDTITEAEWVALDTGGIANRTTQTFGLTDFGMPVMGPDFNQVTANFGGLGGVDVHPSEFAYNGAEGEGDSQVTPPPTYNQLALAGFTKPLPMFRRQGEANAKEINSRLQAGQDFAQATGADVYMNARLEDEKKKHDLKMKEWATDALQALKDIQGNQELKVEDVVQTDRWELQKLVSDHNQSLYRKIDALQNKLLHNGQKRQALLGYGTKDYGQYGVEGNWDSTTGEFVGTHVTVNKPKPGSRFANPVKDVGRTQKYLKMQAEDAAANKEIIELKKQFKDDPPHFDPFVPNNIGPPNQDQWYNTKDGKEAINNIPIWSAKAVFDRYTDFLKNGPHTDDIDITNLIAESDIDFLLDLIEKYVSGGRGPADKWTKFINEWNRRVEGGFLDLGVGPGTVPNSLRNILGHIAGPDASKNIGGEGFSEDDNYYYIRKHYDFGDEDDLRAPIICTSAWCPSADYAKEKGIMQWFNTGKGSDGKTPGDGNGTPTMYMVIKIPKNRKKKKKK